MESVMNEKTIDERVQILERNMHSIRCIMAALTAMMSGYMGAEIKDALYGYNLAILARDAIRVFDLEKEHHERIIGSKKWVTKYEFLSLLMYHVFGNEKSQFTNMTVGNIKEILNEAEEELLERWFSHETT